MCILRFIVSLGLLASTVESVTITPTRFSIPARRLSSGLHQRDEHEAGASKHVVVDFTFGGQQIPVALDSGSTFTYVASTLDTNTADTSDLPALYNPNISSTYRDENSPSDEFDCGGQSVECFMGVDNVATADLIAEGMAFGVATHVETGVFASGQAATMGFGRQANDPSTWLPRDQTFWLRIGASLEMPYLFTVNIYQDQNGTFDFGYIDTTKYTGEIAFVSMDTTQTNWNFKMNGFAIGNGSMQTVDVFVGVVDTGGPNIGLPSYVVNPYFDSFGGSPSPGNSHDYPCSAYPPPDLTLYFESGETLVLNGTFLVEPPDGSLDTCSGRLDDSEQSAYNIGASVLDQKFVVFIGFADKRQDGQPEGVPPGNCQSAM
jgi:aspergillopepsin I